ncbi:hypothetical protein L486_01927 [Kwoniella mangroviensis CBS 10435]|uniref:Homeobox domain-containing protein n=1 Tax=Kwoniella mangroviensis CBS 10435 TaxID=1331196 RepID=A0A1B9J3D0_9TREE|nr:hypothetical protein L486_01927 [Kwoniella mangroviensis CBS 10435]
MTVAMLERLIDSADHILNICGKPQHVIGLQQPQVGPRLVIPDPRALRHSLKLDCLPPHVQDLLLSRIVPSIEEAQNHASEAYRNMISNCVAVGSADDVRHPPLETSIVQLVETYFTQQCQKIERTVSDVVVERMISQGENGRRPTSFNTRTLQLLEASYSRTKILSTAETAIIAEAAGITPHQVRTWFQNKRNRGSKRNPSSSANRPIQALPKRAQQIKLETSPFSPSPAPIKRQVRGLPKRAQAQVSHNAPNSSILHSSLGNLPFSEESSSIGHGEPPHMGNGNGERMNRSPSLTSTISNSSETPNGGFISPFDAQNIPQIAIEWGTGTLNVPVDVLEGGNLPKFNFTPPSPLNLNFNSLFNPSPNSVNNGMNSMFGGQVYDTPTSNSASFNPFAQQPNLDFAAGLESIETLLSSALSNPSSFEQFSTLAASPQISLDSLSPRSDTLESIPSIVSASGSNINSPSWLAGNGEEGLDGGFFEALEGLLASQNNGEGGLGSSFSESVYGGTTERKASTSSQISGIISAEEGIDVSYIAGIPLPPSPTCESFNLSDFDNIAGPSFSHNERTPFINDNISPSFTENDFLTQSPSGMCTPSSTTSAHPLITPTTASEITQEPLVEIDQNQWNWMSGVLPFDMVGMEVEMMEFGNDAKIDGEPEWRMGLSNGDEMMAL